MIVISGRYIFALVLLSGSGAFATHTRPGAVNGVSTTVDNRILVELQPGDTRRANLFDLNGMTLVFTPDGQGGYSRSVQPLAWEEGLGDEINEGEEIALEFPFDFGGQTWTSFHVSKHGALTFGRPLAYWYDDAANRFDTMGDIATKFVTDPTISPLFKPGYGGITGTRDPLARQLVAHLPDRVVVTWFASEPHFYAAFPPDTPDRFQAVLSADGGIRFHYGFVTAGDGVVGLFSHGNDIPRGDLIAAIPDSTNPELPGHLDLVDVDVYETHEDAVIVEFTMRGPVPEPGEGTRFSYRLAFDGDRPYWDPEYTRSRSDADFEVRMVLRTGAEHRVDGGRLLEREGNRIVVLGIIPENLRGKPVSVIAEVACFENPDCRSADFSRTELIELPPRSDAVDLSRSDGRFGRRHSEVFHYRSAPDTVMVACRVIDALGDRFDLFMFHNEFRIDSQENATPAGPTYGPLPDGIGDDRREVRPAPCGDGRLKKPLSLPVLSQNLGQDLGINFLTHEFVHLWSAYLSFASNREKETLTNGYYGIHWRGDLHSPAAFPRNSRAESSVMGGSVWHDNGDGTFTPSASWSGLSWLDLYAMGLADASEVSDTFVLRNLEAIVAGSHNPRGETYRRGVYTGDQETVSIDQIIAAEGVRRPGASQSQKDFNLGFVYLLEPGRAPSGHLLDAHAQLREKFVENWFQITGGRSRITTHVGPRITQEFPHFADGVWQGQSTTSDLVLVNVDTSVVHPAVYFYSPAGDLIAPESVVDVRGDVEATVDGGVTTAIEPSGEWTLATRGRNELVTGSVRVISDGPLGGILRFNDATAGVAGVGAGQPVNDAIFPARRQAGGINTGAAIRNLGEHAITVRCQLLQEGNVRMEAEVPLAVNGQAARFINELFPDTDTSDFVGSVRCRAPAGALFAGVALEMDFQNRIFTTLPVVPVPPVRTQEDTQLHFAHFANGSSIASDLVLVNVAAGPVRPAIYFHDQEGELIAPAAVVDVRGDLEVSEDGALTFGRTLRPLGERTLTTTGEGELKVGSVRVVSDGPVGGVLRFDHPELGVAGVGASQPLTAAVFLARRQADGINTGVAIRNLETETLTVTCKLTRNGHEQAETPIQLEANAQTARFIDEMFKEADTSDFLGSVRCAAPEGLRFTGVALEMDVGRRIFTTLPVVPIQ